MKVLMCTDGEDFAEDAIRFGGRLAKAMNADVSILHVRPNSPQHGKNWENGI